MPAAQYELEREEYNSIPYAAAANFRVAGTLMVMVMANDEAMATREAFLNFLNTTEIKWDTDGKESEDPVIIDHEGPEYWVIAEGELVALGYHIDRTAPEYAAYQDLFFLKKIAGVWYGQKAELKPLA